MSITGAQLRALVALGITGDQLLAVVDVMEMRHEASRDARDVPVTSAERSRSYRERKRHEERDERHVTPPPPAYTTPPKEQKPKKVSVSMQLPENWTLTEEDRAFARGQGWTESKIDREGERFKNHSLDKGRKHKNVRAAWRNWVTSPLQSEVNGNGRPVQRNGIMEAADRLIARTLRNPWDESSDLLSGQGKTDVRLLPPGRRE